MATPAKIPPEGPLPVVKLEIVYDPNIDNVTINGHVKDPLVVMDAIGRAMMMYSQVKRAQRKGVLLADEMPKAKDA